MKRLMIFLLAVSSLLTVGKPVWAQSSAASVRTKLEVSRGNLGFNPQRVTPLIGTSSVEGKNSLSGGLTIDIGSSPRLKFETGLLALSTGAAVRLQGANSDEVITTNSLAVPLAAKLRLMALHAQSWSLKAGLLPAAKIGGDRDNLTRDFDVLGSLGFNGRLAFTHKTDLVIEASYNRGLMDSLRTPGPTYNEGFLILAGFSIRI